MMQSLRCNICGCDVDGVAYRTRCRHFYCPQCARKAFECNTVCKCCNNTLSNGDVLEITVGIATTGTSLMDSLYHFALQQTSWGKVAENIRQISSGVDELYQFLSEQLSFQSASDTEIVKTMGTEIDSYKDQIKMLRQDLEAQKNKFEETQNSILIQSNSLEHQLFELQEAYKEKARKCQAWEKAYNNIRAQISDTTGVHMQAQRSIVAEDMSATLGKASTEPGPSVNAFTVPPTRSGVGVFDRTSQSSTHPAGMVLAGGYSGYPSTHGAMMYQPKPPEWTPVALQPQSAPQQQQQYPQGGVTGSRNTMETTTTTRRYISAVPATTKSTTQTSRDYRNQWSMQQLPDSARMPPSSPHEQKHQQSISYQEPTSPPATISDERSHRMTVPPPPPQQQQQRQQQQLQQQSALSARRPQQQLQQKSVSPPPPQYHAQIAGQQVGVASRALDYPLAGRSGSFAAVGGAAGRGGNTARTSSSFFD